MKVVKEHWVADFEGNPFQILQYKLKGILTKWSKEAYGNIFH